MGNLETLLACGLSLILAMVVWMLLWVRDKSEQSALALQASLQGSPIRRVERQSGAMPTPTSRGMTSGAGTDWSKQVPKWVTSGLVTFLFVGLFVIVLAALARGVGALPPDAATSVLSAVSSTGDPMLAIAFMLLTLATVAVVLALPIGYLQYQVYYWIYWGGVRVVGRHGDIGYTILKDADQTAISQIGRSLRRPPPLRKTRSLPGLSLWRFSERNAEGQTAVDVYQYNMSLANSAWSAVLNAHDAHHLDRPASSLSDIYHSLGAVRVAVIAAYLCFLVLAFGLVALGKSWDALAAGSAGVLFNAAIAYLLLVMLTRTREDVLDQLIGYKRDIMTFLGQGGVASVGDGADERSAAQLTEP